MSVYIKGTIAHSPLSLRMNNSNYHLLLLVPGLVSPLSQGACPDGWVDGTFVDMGCLLFNHTEMVTWLEGAQSCQQGYERASYIEILTSQVN